MGIPNYFSYIIKNHSNIIRTLNYHKNVEKTRFNALYMDCNSIIYDAIRQIENMSGTKENQVTIIGHVIDKIKQYIVMIAPTTTVYIAFDGVAPFAKMEQQKTRRYKSTFMQTIDFENESVFTESEVDAKCKTGFSSCNITPGTKFMELLSKHIEYAFSASNAGGSNSPKIIVSTSNEPGEGEHKMFAYMREHVKVEQTVAVYGLDADLIMLSIIHSLLCKNVYICREAPEFSYQILKNQIDLDKNNPNELLLMNIEIFSKSILKEMGINTFDTGRIYDYIFLCFFLGNDFLPHFPALNIRTHGIQQLLDVYAKEISGGGTDRYFISTKTGKIQWKWVFVFLREIAKHERDFILSEYNGRNHLRGRLGLSSKTAKDRETLFENTPVLYRAEELYICPYEQGWESRYYLTAFGEAGEPAFIKNVCVNYLEGLEWVFKYYTEGCPDWRWKYKYNYPPLLVDLVKFVPQFETDFFGGELEAGSLSMTPLSPREQLIYVLPKNYHYLIPGGKINENYAHFFPEVNNLKFQWMFCRYFWECHIELPEMGISVLAAISRDVAAGKR